MANLSTGLRGTEKAKPSGGPPSSSSWKGKASESRGNGRDQVSSRQRLSERTVLSRQASPSGTLRMGSQFLWEMSREAWQETEPAAQILENVDRASCLTSASCHSARTWRGHFPGEFRCLRPRGRLRPALSVALKKTAAAEQPLGACEAHRSLAMCSPRFGSGRRKEPSRGRQHPSGTSLSTKNPGYWRGEGTSQEGW